MYFITGDTHRDFSHIETFCEKYKTNKSDTMIVLGDAGLNYFQNKSDINLKIKVSSLPIKFLFIRGNHEARPQDIDTYKIIKFCNSFAYAEKEFPDLVFTMDGQVYNIEYKTVLTIGGAYSIDKQYRLSRGFEWFKNEQLSKDEMDNILNKYKETKVDCILSHTAPDSEIPYPLLPSALGNIPNIDKTMELWLDEIKKNVEYDKWYCGHFHINYGDDRFRFMYNDIRAL